jgi:hypothetical protein
MEFQVIIKYQFLQSLTVFISYWYQTFSHYYTKYVYFKCTVDSIVAVRMLLYAVHTGTGKAVSNLKYKLIN